MQTSFRSTSKSLTRVSILFIITIIAMGTASAGTGKFEPDGNGGGKFNFCVSVRFNATEAQLQIIRKAFEDSSQVLADATDGHHRFGTINIVNNSGSSEEAEFWVLASGGRAVATYRQFGKKGQHILLPGLFIQVPPDVQAFWNAVNAYTIAHEFSHHAYGLLDEYVNRNGQRGANISCPPPPADVCNRDLDYCLMDGFSQRGGGACPSPDRPITMNEFCVASNHDKPNSNGDGDGETAQSVFNHRSCWETISRLDKAWKIPAPTLAVSAPPLSSPSPTFGTSCGKPRVAVLIDRSGSMSNDNRLTFAKLGAEQFINSFANGSLAVVSFAISSSVNFPLTEINDDATRNNAKAAVNALVADGPTNIGDGLLMALAQLNSQGDCSSCEKIIILLSDGEHNTGTPPESVIPQLNSAGVKLITSVVGSSISISGESSLRNITSQTNGEYYRVSTAADATGGSFPGYGASGLVGLFMRLGSDMKGDAMLKQERELMTSGQVKEVPILVESTAVNATFAVTIADAIDSVIVSLRSPSGVIYTGATSPNVEFTSTPNSRVFRVNAPQQGTWTVTLSAGSIRTGKMEVLSFGKHDGVRLDAWVNQEVSSSIDSVKVYATPTFEGERVTGASVTGTVIRPDGSKLPIGMFDDGLDSHGDLQVNDGIYSAIFNSYSSDGTYAFELLAQNSTGRAYAGEPLNPDAPSNDRPLPAFVRAASTTATVFGLTQGDTIWIDDVLPQGATPHGDWYWVDANPAPIMGGASHQSKRTSYGLPPAVDNEHSFDGATSQLPINPGDVLFTYVFLDPNNLPREIMLQWNDGTWEHRAYWGANLIDYGLDGTDSRRYMGPLPAAARWVRLEVPASLVGLESRNINGMAFTLDGARATWDAAGKRTQNAPLPTSSDFVWVEDAVPTGSLLETVNDQWLWLEPHFSGTQGHRSYFTVNKGAGQFRSHSFRNAPVTMNVQPGDVLFTYVFLDSLHMPDELVLQWRDGDGWEHRAFWGQNFYEAGIMGTESRRYLGGIPPADRWVRLEVPASYVGLEGKVVDGMAYGFYSTVDHAGINWDYSGKSPRAAGIPVPLAATAAVYQIPNGSSGVTYSTNDRASQFLKFYAHPGKAAGTVPFYRFRRTGDNPEKFYSRCLPCYDGNGWQLDGIAFYVYEDDSTPGTVPLYLYHDSQTHYFLTTDQNEANSQHLDSSTWAYVLPTNPQVPAAPSSLTYSNSYLHWQDNSANETGFRIEGFDITTGLWTQLNTVDANVTFFKIGVLGRSRVRAFNSFGNSGYSNEVQGWIVYNSPPLVMMSGPVDGEVVGRDVTIDANVFDNEGIGTIARVEFFADNNKLGEVTTPAYTFVWIGAPLGSHVLTVKATDTAGASTTSSPISISVSANPPVFFDDFNDNLLDANKWTVNYPGGSPLVSEQSQQLQITLAPNTAGYNGVDSVSTYDLTGRMVQVEVAQAVSQAGWVENFLILELDANNSFLIDVGTQLIFRSRVNGVNDQTVNTYNPTAHHHWRIRHDQSTNTINFETSADAVVWTTRKTVTPGFALTSLRFRMGAGAWGTGNAAPGAAKYDNFKLLASTAGSTSLSVPNFGFETPVVGYGNFQYGPTSGAWTFAGGTGVSASGSGFTSGGVAPEGNQIAFIQGGNTSIISQSITGFQANTNYIVTFAAIQRTNCCNSGGQDIQVYLDTNLLATFHPATYGYVEYSTSTFTTTAGAHTLKFVGLNPLGGDHTAFVDNIRIIGSP